MEELKACTGEEHLFLQVLAPVVLFALLHFASYSLALLDTLGERRTQRISYNSIFVAYFAPSFHKIDKIIPFASSGQNSWWGARMLISLVEFQSRNILRLLLNTRLISSLISQQDGCIQRDLPNALQHHDDLHR